MVVIVVHTVVHKYDTTMTLSDFRNCKQDLLKAPFAFPLQSPEGEYLDHLHLLGTLPNRHCLLSHTRYKQL